MTASAMDSWWTLTCRFGLSRIGRTGRIPLRIRRSTAPEVFVVIDVASATARRSNADFHAGGSAQGSEVLIAEGPAAPPGYAGIGGEGGFAQDG